MAHVSVSDVQPYATPRKLNLGASLDGDMEASMATQVIAQLSPAFDVTTWLDVTTTPALVRVIIGMEYMAFWYQATFAEDSGVASYAGFLLRYAQMLINGLLAGNITLTDVPNVTHWDSPEFYPNDTSSALNEWDLDILNPERGSVGPAYFTMGKVF
jgi:hypothetical protein